MFSVSYPQPYTSSQYKRSDWKLSALHQAVRRSANREAIARLMKGLDASAAPRP